MGHEAIQFADGNRAMNESYQAMLSRVAIDDVVGTFMLGISRGVRCLF
jgi:hypothetical protein